MQAFANNHFVCFSSQKLPYGGASVFVYGILAHFHNIIKTRNILKNIPRFWYASSKHIPYSNKLPSQFVTNTPYVSPLKNCRTVVRQFLYYGVRVPTTRNNNKKAIRYKYLMAFLVRCRSRHSVSKGPPDLSPKFFRFAQNLDTRVRAPTTQNNKITVRNKS